MEMKFKDGKSKVLTLSYDDCVVQDIRLMEILDNHGIKATFNVNTGMYLPEDGVREETNFKLKLSEAQKLYTDSGHEVAVHTLTHPHLETLSRNEVATQVVEDRQNIEKQFGILPRGMAYPYGTYTPEIMATLQNCGIGYARTVLATEGFGFPENWLEWHPTCHHNHPDLMELAKKFAEDPCEGNRMFYLWGHSYEFDLHNNWDVMEAFAKYIGGRDDIWYATNIEIFDYVTAYENLQISGEEKTVYNPSAIDLWFVHEGASLCIKGGQTLRFL